MGDEWIDSNVVPGFPGQVGTGEGARLQVYLLTTAVAMPQTIFPALNKTASPGNPTPSLWLNFMCDDGAGNGIPFYIITQAIGGTINAATPDPIATAVPALNANRQTVYVPANVEWQRKFFANQEFRAIQVSGANAYLRVEATSEPS